MRLLKLFSIIVMIAFANSSFKSGETQTKANNISELKTQSDSIVNKSSKLDYKVVDTLDFALDKQEDFINAFDLLSGNQFLITDRFEDGKYRILIAEGSFSKDDLKIYCSYSSSKPNTNTDWQICLRSLIDRFEITTLQNECIFILKRENSIGLYGKACTDLSALNRNLPHAQEKEDNLSDQEKFDQFYYDFFVQINNNIGSVDFFSLAKKNLWSGTSGPEKYEDNLLKRLLNNIEKKHAEKVDLASFRIDKEDEMRDYMYQQYLHGRIVSVKFDGKEHKVVAYDIE